ncbi:NAD(P)-dependent oxidoreductase [Micromonospora sp. CA-244673]|uniref:NAD(P)-dependent oxidoreductase n=1 Tax=Micromonospora sp. CA-244673 TaxID=3239958 RepID=UPI003D902F07
MSHTATQSVTLLPTLGHQVVFQGTADDAGQAFDHYLAKLGGTVESVVRGGDSLTGFMAQARIHVLGVGTAVLSVSSPANTADVDPHSYVANLTILDCVAGDFKAAQALFRRLELLPLTNFELATVRRQFPLTQELARSCGRKALAGYAFLMAIHHVTDFVAMMDALVDMGADPRHITILDKGYPYTQRHRVDAWLRDTLGIHVDLYPDRANVIGDHIARAKAQGLKSIIFDDGGHCWPIVAEHYPASMEDFVGIVEQTMSGIWKLEGVPLPLPVFSVAESQLKSTMESYGVALAGVRSILNRIPHEKLEGRPALVLGYGRIGRQVAHVLRSLRMRVAVYDKETVALVAAHEEGFATSRSLTGLIESHQPLLLVGSAGRNSLRGEHLAAFKKSAYLASVTSRTYEFVLDEFAQVAKSVHDYGRLGHGYLLDGGVELCVVGHGMPVNFYHADSLPNRYIDLIVSSLLLGGVQLAKPDQGGFQPGHNLDLTNKILNASPALDTYYDWYGEPSARRDLLTPGETAPTFQAVPWTFPPLP